ncbi:hypothetical protein [Fundicoccus culcitae]|uniref:Uncharacterized protein n=1 Tax=Fundicoccus culcitae TaxID=2969821 RepID=A0ABY5P8Q4_9LACT|nr:hypothetical protein [Fundicoccus culcitae]UUX35132.1 hypothetical protein NRE15_05685 [Fundicoccus culcitae]
MNDKTLIVLKAKAWLDLKSRKEQDDKSVDGRDVKKHLNDISRLAGSLMNSDKFILEESIQKDMTIFLHQLENNKSTIPQNNDILLSRDEIVTVLNELLG